MGYTKEQCTALKKELQSLSDEKYRKFNESLIPGAGIKSYGVRIPQLRKIARGMIKDDWRGFLSLTAGETDYELVMLSGMTIALSKCDFEEKLSLLASFIPRINNWAVCDVVSGDMKSAKTNRERTFAFLQPYLSSDKEFEVRFAVVMLMQHFMTDEYIDRVLTIYNAVGHDGYYVKMAVAWGISVCFVKYREKTLAFLKDCSLDDFTFNKSIQKIRESYRVDSADKELLNRMKR